MGEGSIMVTASVLRGVTTYLSSLNARSAVYNEDLTLIWASEDGFFKSIDPKFISAAMPIREERHLSLEVDGERYAVSVTPLYRSKRLVCGYVCVMRDSTEIYMMANSSAVSDYVRLFLQDIQEKANRIISVSKVMEGLVPEGENGEKLQELIRSQYIQSQRIFTEATGSKAILPPVNNGEGTSAANCHVPALISGLCGETSQCLVKTKRRLVKDIDMRNCYARADYRLLAMAFMSLLRTHLHISPLKSDIKVITRFDELTYVVAITSELLPKGELDSLQQEKSRHNWELAKKIVVSDCGGTLVFNTDNNTATSEMKLPVIRKNRGPSLNNANSEYIAGNYKPVHPFIDEITEAEELAINMAKESKAVSAAKSVQKKKKK